MKSLIKKYKSFPLSIRASFWFLICAFLQKGVSFITTPIFTRIMSTAEYGQYSVFNSWYSIVAVFVSLNLYFGVYAQGLVKFESERVEFISSLQGLTTTLVLAWTGIYLLFREFWNGIFTLTTPQMLAMLVMIWTTAVFNFWSMEQRVELKYRALVIVTIIVSLLKPVLGIYLVLHSDDKVTARIMGLMAVELVAYSWMYFVQMKNGKKFFNEKFWKYALVFNIPLIPHYLSSSILNSADRIMIGRMVDSGSAGIYNLAYNVSQIMTMFNMALIQTTEPWLYKTIKGKKFDRISYVAYPAFIGIAFVNIVLIILAPEVVAVFAPSSYYDAIWIIPPVAMSVFFMFTYNFFAVFEFYYEKTKFIAAATVAGAIMNIVLNYICINIWGYIAAGYTTLFCYALYAIAHYVFMKKICRDYLENVEVYNTRKVLLITISFLCIGFCCLASYRFTVLRYFVVLTAIGVIGLFRTRLLLYFNKLVQIRKEGKLAMEDDE